LGVPKHVRRDITADPLFAAGRKRLTDAADATANLQ